ncbi:MAG TPA: FtsX-like permease family protein, partial [Longimicrobiales bacterium]|nr:FtsX-like permease family protein [Longimicrobiales bacterium]
HPVTPGYFEALGATFAEGRAFDETEARVGPTPIVVNDVAARELAPGGGLVGRTVRFGRRELQVVGIVDGIRHWGADQPVEAEFYAPYRREGTWRSGLTFAVRGSPVPGADALRRAVEEAAPRAIVSAVRPMTEIMSSALARQRFYTLVLGVFAGTALLLAAAGLAGTLLYDVRRRRHELGVRMALGAPAGRLVRRIVGGGLLTVAGGAALGLLAYWPLARHLEELIPGVEPGDPLALAGFAAVLAGSALLASWIPARLAAGTDPAAIMR